MKTNFDNHVGAQQIQHVDEVDRTLDLERAEKKVNKVTFMDSLLNVRNFRVLRLNFGVFMDIYQN